MGCSLGVVRADDDENGFDDVLIIVGVGDDVLEKSLRGDIERGATAGDSAGDAFDIPFFCMCVLRTSKHLQSRTG